MRKTVSMRLVEFQHGGKDLKTVLQESFERNQTSTAVAAELGITLPTLVDWLNMVGARRQVVRSCRTVITFPEEPAGVS